MKAAVTLFAADSAGPLGIARVGISCRGLRNTSFADHLPGIAAVNTEKRASEADSWPRKPFLPFSLALPIERRLFL